MHNSVENGRSMIEMLGVLTIIGVLSVGGLSVFNRMQYEHMSNQIINDLTETITKIQKISTQYDDGYKNVGVFAYKNKAYSDGLTFVSSTATSATFSGKGSVQYAISGSSGESFNVAVSKLDDNICIKLATTGINNVRNISVNGKSVGSVNVTLTNAADECNKGLKNQVDFSVIGY